MSAELYLAYKMRTVILLIDPLLSPKLLTSLVLCPCVYMCKCEVANAVSVCRRRGVGSALWRAGSWASGPEELAERQSSYFHYTSSHIQPCSPYLTKHLHPAVQQQHKHRWGRTASPCVCLHVRDWEWVTLENYSSCLRLLHPFNNTVMEAEEETNKPSVSGREA